MPANGTCPVSLRETDAISPDDLEKASKRKIVRINTQIKKLMSIVCSICGGTGVKCTAVIDPNTRQFLEFTRNALSDGRCSQCGNVALTDPDEVKAEAGQALDGIYGAASCAPNYTCCDIVRHGDYDGCEKAYIRIGGPSDVVEKYPVVAVCRDSKSSNHLRSLTRRENLPSWEFKGSSSTTCWKTRPTRSGWTT